MRVYLNFGDCPLLKKNEHKFSKLSKMSKNRAHPSTAKSTEDWNKYCVKNRAYKATLP